MIVPYTNKNLKKKKPKKKQRNRIFHITCKTDTSEWNTRHSTGINVIFLSHGLRHVHCFKPADYIVPMLFIGLIMGFHSVNYIAIR